MDTVREMRGKISKDYDTWHNSLPEAEKLISYFCPAPALPGPAPAPALLFSCHSIIICTLRIFFGTRRAAFYGTVVDFAVYVVLAVVGDVVIIVMVVVAPSHHRIPSAA